jgi:hypothetical protein
MRQPLATWHHIRGRSHLIGIPPRPSEWRNRLGYSPPQSKVPVRAPILKVDIMPLVGGELSSPHLLLAIHQTPTVESAASSHPFNSQDGFSIFLYHLKLLARKQLTERDTRLQPGSCRTFELTPSWVLVRKFGRGFGNTCRVGEET